MSFSEQIRPAVSRELALAKQAESSGCRGLSFKHLERAHVLGQASTSEHVRVHWAMFLWGLRRRDWREVIGQCIRMVGAATKTAVGLVPHGNTGGSNVRPWQRMPIADDLIVEIERAQNNSALG
ncbi:DUF3703 domain-containing protein [bacterium]|nr:DUF3703 domain-containing protein [bacterium]